ncbi:MAG: hypothetical protein Q8Q09_24025 [Deltaproteobacteria bacterium]|nr:hypothetical protein [Deltaproteobacteria bacterium]
MRRNSIAAFAAATAVGLVAGDAQAQFWLTDRNLSAGRGIRVGNFELHPGVGAEFGFDSNTGFVAPSAPSTAALRMRVSANFAISTLTAQRTRMPSDATTPASQPLQFRANAGVTYHHFFALGSNDVAPNVGFNVGLSLTATPSRVVSFSATNDFARAVQGASELNFGQLFVFNRFQNTASLALGITPGGGSLEFKFNYSNRLNFFTEQSFSSYSNMGNDIGMAIRWRFLPKTSIAWTTSFSPTIYFDPAPIATGLFTSFPINSRLGVTGLITERLSFQVFGGYGATYFGQGDNLETFVGNAEIRYITGPNMAIKGGLLRDIGASLIGNFMVRNNVYVNVSHSFGGRFLLSGEFSGGLTQIGYAADRTGARSNILTGSAVGADGRLTGFRVLGLVFGEVRFSEVVGLNATAAISGNFIDAQFTSMAMGTTGLNWVKFEAFLGLRVNW